MLKQKLRHFDGWSLFVIALTFILFTAALFLKGLTHELLLEAGVFLVSIKLIHMAHKNAVHAEMMEERLERISSMLQSARESAGPQGSRSG